MQVLAFVYIKFCGLHAAKILINSHVSVVALVSAFFFHNSSVTARFFGFDVSVSWIP